MFKYVGSPCVAFVAGLASQIVVKSFNSVTFHTGSSLTYHWSGKRVHCGGILAQRHKVLWDLDNKPSMLLGYQVLYMRVSRCLLCLD
jgi:hypothetical protein